MPAETEAHWQCHAVESAARAGLASHGRGVDSDTRESGPCRLSSLHAQAAAEPEPDSGEGGPGHGPAGAARQDCPRRSESATTVTAMMWLKGPRSFAPAFPALWRLPLEADETPKSLSQALYVLAYLSGVSLSAFKFLRGVHPLEGGLQPPHPPRPPHFPHIFGFWKRARRAAAAAPSGGHGKGPFSTATERGSAASGRQTAAAAPSPPLSRRGSCGLRRQGPLAGGLPPSPGRGPPGHVRVVRSPPRQRSAPHYGGTTVARGGTAANLLLRRAVCQLFYHANCSTIAICSPLPLRTYWLPLAARFAIGSPLPLRFALHIHSARIRAGAVASVIVRRSIHCSREFRAAADKLRARSLLRGGIHQLRERK